MSKDRRLGRGLAALLGAPLDEEQTGFAAPTPNDPRPAADSPAATPEALNLSVYEIDDNPFQPRRVFTESEIASLAESLKEHDMLQPVLVRRVGSRYQLISGERRLRAAIQAGWTNIPARVREADDRLVAELAIVENLQRQDLNAIEKALSFQRYLDQHRCTQEDLAKRLKIDRSTIANLVRLLELPNAVQSAISDGHISAGHARALLPLGDEQLQIEYTDRIRQEGWSVREVERQVSDRIRVEDGETLSVVGRDGKRRKAQAPEQVSSLEHEFRMVLGAKVEIQTGKGGRGKLVIHFANNDEFERLRAAICGSSARSQVA